MGLDKLDQQLIEPVEIGRVLIWVSTSSTNGGGARDLDRQDGGDGGGWSRVVDGSGRRGSLRL